MDLIGRKLLRDGGKAMNALIAEMQHSADPKLRSGIEILARATGSVLAAGKEDVNHALAVATPFLSVCGTVIAGWLLTRSAGQANGADPAFGQAKRATAAFFAANILPEAEAEAALVTGGAASTLDFPMEAF
ncbi:MAG: acyl-CoA dehydrogenase C-terminal domain-containing protein [Dongia sp.]